MAELEFDEDKELLLDGIIHVFELIPANSTFSPAEMNNYSSSLKLEARGKVEQILWEEIAEGSCIITSTGLVLLVLFVLFPRLAVLSFGLFGTIACLLDMGLILMSRLWISYIFRQLMMLSSLSIRNFILLRSSYFLL